MIKNNVFVLSLALALLITIPSALAFNYEITYFDSSSTGNNVDTDPVSFLAEEADSILFSQNLFFTFNVSSPPDSYTATYQSPFSTTFGVTSETLNSNQSCLNLGTATKSYTQDNAEGRNTITHDGSASSFISTGNRYNIITDERFITINQDTLDSENFMPNIYFRNECIVGIPIASTNITQFFNSDNFKECVNIIPTRITRNYTSCATDQPKYYGYTIFNATAGNISFASRAPDNNGVTLHILYPFDEPSTIIESCVNTIDCVKNVNLEPNRLYVVGVGADVIAGGIDTAPTINVTIDLGVADYECPAFGPCVDGFQTRECIDANGLQPNLIENRACSLVILQNATLGFEEFFTTSDILKCEPQWFFGCSYTIANVTLDRPLNWTVVDPAYGSANFLQMTQEYATEGTRSLKMWQIPPKQGEVLTNVSCGNLTTSVIPQVFQGVSNDTFSVSHNVTFPATNMQISFDVKRCQRQALQHSELTGLFNLTLCPTMCYGQDCSTPPNGTFAFNLLDTITGASVFGVPQFGEAELQTLSPTFDISNLGIIPGRIYNVVFAISNENPNDATGNCVYVDNVKYQVTEQSLLEFVPGCESRCLGTTRIEATKTVSGSCFIVTQEFSPLCVDAETGELIENQEDFCDSETGLLQTFIDKTGKYESVDCSETDKICSEGRCQTEEEATEGSTTPTEGINLINEIIQFVSTRMFWALVITGIIFAAGIVTVSSLSSNPHWEGPALLALIPLVFFIAIGWLPLETGALIMLPIALMIVNQFKKAT